MERTDPNTKAKKLLTAAPAGFEPDPAASNERNLL